MWWHRWRLDPYLIDFFAACTLWLFPRETTHICHRVSFLDAQSDQSACHPTMRFFCAISIWSSAFDIRDDIGVLGNEELEKTLDSLFFCCVHKRYYTCYKRTLVFLRNRTFDTLTPKSIAPLSHFCWFHILTTKWFWKTFTSFNWKLNMMWLNKETEISGMHQSSSHKTQLNYHSAGNSI